MHARKAFLLMVIVCLTLPACDRDKPASQAPRDNEAKAAARPMRGVRRESLKLMPNDATAGDSFGRAVAADDKIAIIGAPGAMAGSGSAYVFDITTGEQLLKLTASDAANGDRLSFSVAVSGNIAVIGGATRGPQAKAGGAAYVFDITTGEQLFKLTAPDDADRLCFGMRVAIDGDIAMVAAPQPGYAEHFASGSVYLFDVTTGERLFRLTASDAAAGDGFGASVAIVDNIAVVTSRALRADENQAYVFDATTGAQLLKFPFPGEGSGVSVHDNIAIITSFRGGDEGEVTVSTHLYDVTTGEQLRELTVDSGGGPRLLGVTTAIGGDLAIVGGSLPEDVAHVFNVTTGKECLRLSPSLASIPSLARSALAMTASGDRAIMGVHEDDEGGGEAGAVYVFDLTADNEPWPVWGEYRQLFKLTASDDEACELGHRVAASGNIAIAGAPLTDTDAAYQAGAAYVFDIETGEQLFKLTAPDATERGGFGTSVDISGNTAIVGAYQHDMPIFRRSGAAYLFDVTTGELLGELTSADPTANDGFGMPVAISGNIALVGADNAKLAGSKRVYVFDITTNEMLLEYASPDAIEEDGFGHCMDVSGSIAIIGAPGYGVPSAQGAAYLFNVATGEQLFELTASDGERGDRFGISVAINDSVAIVGAERLHSAGRCGEAYVFDITTGKELFKLTADDASRGDLSVVALSGNLAMTGSSLPSSHPVRLFNVTTGEYLLKITSPDTAHGDEFGLSLALVGNVAVVASPGIHHVDEDTAGGGALYVFEFSIPATDEPQAPSE